MVTKLNIVDTLLDGIPQRKGELHAGILMIDTAYDILANRIERLKYAVEQIQASENGMQVEYYTLLTLFRQEDNGDEEIISSSRGIDGIIEVSQFPDDLDIKEWKELQNQINGTRMLDRYFSQRNSEGLFKLIKEFDPEEEMRGAYTFEDKRKSNDIIREWVIRRQIEERMLHLNKNGLMNHGKLVVEGGTIYHHSKSYNLRGKTPENFEVNHLGASLDDNRVIHIAYQLNQIPGIEVKAFENRNLAFFDNWTPEDIE